MAHDISREKIRILVAKPGADGHRIGVQYLCQAFRDVGWEVVYTGLYQTPEMIARTAVDEDVDVVALSSLSMTCASSYAEVKKLLDERDSSDVVVVAGGLIPERDKPFLEDMGITGNYGPGTPIDDIIGHITDRVRGTRKVA